MILNKATKEQALNIDGSDYNKTAWAEKINRISNYGDCEFYIEAKTETGKTWDTLWAIYTIPEGIRILGSFSPYSSSVTNRGFSLVYMSENGEVTKGFSGMRTGNTGTLENNKANREYMAKQSKLQGAVFSTNI